jgi:hypothetical protein
MNMRKIPNPTESDIENWIQHGIKSDAKYMCIVLDDVELRPFFVFKEQSIISQIYNIHKVFGNKSLLCVMRLNDINTNMISIIANALCFLNVDLEN